ncbi:MULTISPECIES: DUF3593 domain-containing protein [Prochlorococcus]|uniref:Uncharacterized conserved membrane protein n=1 Tax=Prochlorococcus marinus (strain SARG / CCMP1375 / SS120) TaxID=167539 RepID=Q7VC12_PROMA|nr:MULTISPECIES: DUF3593 domain-containing protein [Prochlorococcus]AAP99974.1 Uncharacterized conserved membrane protein [Prochlorococcus marinus subsp. marinus str. CCMP1375]KGG18906.1 hypothetical protein EV08_1393 [Prochlorococcus marinus str. SS2]KGG23556.1 hypothetical protein EV09_1180 [Prochlorococcus marinus str. SS35]KGG32208.1 hypothetical protein EV10_1323 [Prochlorococcus marinus str. SS51]
MNNFFLLLNSLDPGPIFILSLFPYLVFLYWAQKTSYIPQTALLGFRLTLLFVAMTIIFSIIAKLKYDSELTDVDHLHGLAESFLALSDGLVVLGFFGLMTKTSK